MVECFPCSIFFKCLVCGDKLLIYTCLVSIFFQLVPANDKEATLVGFTRRESWRPTFERLSNASETKKEGLGMFHLRQPK